MIWVLYLVSGALIISVAFVGIPADVRKLIGENCRRGNGRIRLRYVTREIRSVLGFYMQTFFASLLLASGLLSVVLLVDAYLIPMELVSRSLAMIDADPDVWKENLAESAVPQKFENFFVNNGGSSQGVRNVMLFLWYLFPVAAVASFIVFVAGLRMTSQSYQRALDELVRKETALNRRRIARRYLGRTKRAEMTVNS